MKLLMLCLLAAAVPACGHDSSPSSALAASEDALPAFSVDHRCTGSAGDLQFELKPTLIGNNRARADIVVKHANGTTASANVMALDPGFTSMRSFFFQGALSDGKVAKVSVFKAVVDDQPQWQAQLYFGDTVEVTAVCTLDPKKI